MSVSEGTAAGSVFIFIFDFVGGETKNLLTDLELYSKITSVNSMEHICFILNVSNKNTRLLALQHPYHASRVSLWEFAVVC